MNDIAAIARIDSFPYRHRVREIMSAPPVLVSSTMSVHDAARLLIERRISSVFATTDAGEALRLLKDTDLAQRLADNARNEVLEKYTWAAVHRGWRIAYGLVGDTAA